MALTDPVSPPAVLVVEDQRSLAELLASMLRGSVGCECVLAASLAQARQALQERPQGFLAAVCDVNLPDAPYGEVIDLVSQSGIPVVALAGTISPDVRNMMRQGTIVDYVLKKGVVAYEYVTQLVQRLQRNRGVKVVVADDSAASRDILQRMLRIQQLQVLTAENGASAIELLRQHTDTRLVLVDYNMPLVDGFEFVLQARRMMGKERLAIIGISGENRPDLSAQFLKHGANDFISKPYSYEEMTCRINQNLEMLELVESMQRLASRDPLTDLYNRRVFFERGQALARPGASEALGLLAMDVDYFKRINDRLGHQAGDAALKAVAQELLRGFPHCTVARLGGEEFGVLAPGWTEGALREHTRQWLVELPHRIVASCPQVGALTMSAGLAWGVQPDDLEALMLTADRRLYQAKEQGRNRLV